MRTILKSIGLLLLLSTAAFATVFSRGTSTLKIVGAGQEAIYMYDSAAEGGYFYLYELDGSGSIAGSGCVPANDGTIAVECPSTGVTKVVVQFSTVNGNHDMVWQLGNQTYPNISAIQITTGVGKTDIGGMVQMIGNSPEYVPLLPNVTSVSVTVPKGSSINFPAIH